MTTIKTKTVNHVLTANQIERGKNAWNMFNATANAHMTFKQKQENEAANAKLFLAQFVGDANGNEKLGLEMALQAFRDSAPKKLTAAQIAELPLDKDIDDAEKSNLARIRKSVQRFKSLMLTGSKSTESDKVSNAKVNEARKAGKAALSATSQKTSEVPFEVQEAAQHADNSPTDLYRTKPIEAVIKSVFSTISHELKVLQIAKRPIEHNAVAMNYCLALADFGLQMSKGEVMPDEAQEHMRTINAKHGR